MAVRAKRKSHGIGTKLQAWDKTLGHCWYCGRPLTWGDVAPQSRPVLEHQHPLCDGGADDLRNLVYSCDGCNQEKGMKSVERFRKMLAARLAGAVRSVSEWLDRHRSYYRSDADCEIARWLRETHGDFSTSPHRFYGELMDRKWDEYVI